MTLIGSFISAAIFYVFAYVLGAKGGYKNTYKGNVYAMTPGLLFSWIPSVLNIIYIIFALWSWYIITRGFSILHGLTMRRALLVTLIPIIIGFVIIISLLMYLAQYLIY